MKKMAKRFFSSVIVLAMLMTLLPATVSQAAIAKAAYGFEDGQMIPNKVHGASTAEIDSTVAYNGNSSMKIVQQQGLATYGKNVTFEVGKTYRISAMYKFAAESSDRSVGFALYAAGDQKAKTKVAYTETVWQSVTSDDSLWWMDRGTNVKVNDTEWHKVSTTLTLKSVDGTTTAQTLLVELRAEGGANTFWVDDFSVVEVLSIDENVKGNAMAVKTFDGASTEVSGSNITRDASTAYEGAASAKVTATGSIINFGTYNFEVGQYYRVSSYIKAQYPAGSTTNNYFKYEFRNNTSGRGGVVSVSSKFNSSTETRPGFSYSYSADEQYPAVGTGWSRLGAHPVNANDTEWLRHESYFTVKSTDATITTADLQVWLWTDVPAGTVINVDSVKIEKLPIVEHWSGTKYGIGTYGGEIVRAAANLEGSGLLTAYYFNTGGGDNHNVRACYNLEKGKKYIASVKVFVPSSNKAAVDALATAPQMAFGDAKMDLVYDQWVDMSYEIDWTNSESAATQISLNAINAAIAKKYYFGAIDVVEVNANTAAADVPEISMNVDDWIPVNAGRNHVPNFEGKADAIVVSNANGVLYQDVTLNDGQEYLAKAKFYVPAEKIKEDGTTEIRFFIIDGEKTVPWNAEDPATHHWTTDVGYAEKSVTKALTAADGDKWITVSLPFTHAKPAYDTDDSYRLKAVVVNTTDGNGNYYISEVEFVAPNSAGIENLEISSNGTVTYTANAADYFLNYEYLDGTTVLASGMILAGEFLPKFDLADVEEPTVKLTAISAYGVAEETVVGTKAVEDVPEVQEGAVVVNSVTINENAADIADVEDGMYVSINYTNSTEEAKQVWLMVAFYNENGLMSATKYGDVYLPVSVEENTVEVPEDEDIVFVEGATTVKAFVWDVDSAKPLCPGYTVE